MTVLLFTVHLTVTVRHQESRVGKIQTLKDLHITALLTATTSCSPPLADLQREVQFFLVNTFVRHNDLFEQVGELRTQ